MVRKENTRAQRLAGDNSMLRSKLVKDLLKNKFMVIVGDSIQRGIYKDLVSLLQRDIVLSDRELKVKGEPRFLNDTLIEGGMKEEMNNGITYTEVRQYQTSTHLIRFYFVTRCYNAYVESIMSDLQSGPQPDLVIMNSCLWDMTRYGTSAIMEYKMNLVLLFGRLSKVLPSGCLMVWNTTLPISKNARGGFLVKEIEYNNDTLRMDVLEANYYAQQVVVDHGFNVLDLHFWFRRRIDWRAADGIHWCPIAHRYISELLMSHVANAWGFPFPHIKFSSLSHPLMQRSDTSIPLDLLDMAARISGEPAHRPSSHSRLRTVSHRSAPYPLLPQPMPQRHSRYDQEVRQSPIWSSCNNSVPIQNSNSFPQSCNRHYSIPVSVSENFRSAWSPYCGDSLRGAERHPGRCARSRNVYY